MNQEISPGKALKARGCIGWIRLQQQARRDIEQVGNAVLKSADHKEHDGKKQAHRLTRGRLGGKGNPHRDADQKITGHAAQQRVRPAQGTLGRRRADEGACHCAVKQAAQMGIDQAQGHTAGPDQIAEIHHSPVASHGLCRDGPLQQRDGEQAVAGEKLAARQQHHGQARRKDAGAHKLCKRRRLHGGGRHRGARASKSDEKAGQNGQNEHSGHWLRHFSLSDLYILFCDFCR